MSAGGDLRVATHEFTGDDAGYLWWRNTHPRGFVLAVSPRKPPLLHVASCDKVDRDRHPGALHARGARQLGAEAKVALRAWLAHETPEATAMIERCPKCGP